ncbi:MAG: alpha/beta fold hydrolase [Hyphomicrobiaceae bacterium]
MARKTSRPSNDRQVVIAVHGSASTGSQWTGLVTELSDKFDVASPDLPGYGKLRNTASFGRPSLYGDAIKIASVAYRAAQPVHLVAHSYGAAVALEYAIENPGDVASLTLVEPALFHLLRSGGPEDRAHYTEICAVASAVRMDCLNGTPRRGMSHFIDYWNGAGTWQSMTPAMQALFAGQSRQVVRNFTAAFSETWPASVCQRILCPTLIVSAEHSRGPTRRVAEILVGAIGQARLERIAGAGHMAPITHADLVNPLIASFLAEADSEPTDQWSREAA